MIKRLLFITTMLFTVMAFNSCGGEDEPASKFGMYETFNTWGSDHQQVRAGMEKLGWTFVNEDGNEMNFEIPHKDIESTVYVHHDFGLLSVSVSYYGMNSFYDQLKKELTKRFNLTWIALPQVEKATSGSTNLDVTLYTFTHKTKGESMGYKMEPHDL